MRQNTVDHIKHEMYDADEARWMGKRRNIDNKRRTNRAERKQTKQILERFEDYDMYDDLDDVCDEYDEYWYYICIVMCYNWWNNLTRRLNGRSSKEY